MRGASEQRARNRSKIDVGSLHSGPSGPLHQQPMSGSTRLVEVKCIVGESSMAALVSATTSAPLARTRQYSSVMFRRSGAPATSRLDLAKELPCYEVKRNLAVFLA